MRLSFLITAFVSTVLCKRSIVPVRILSKLNNDVLFPPQSSILQNLESLTTDHYRAVFSQNIFKLCHVLDLLDPSSLISTKMEMWQQQLQLLSSHVTKKEITSNLIKKLKQDLLQTKGCQYGPLKMIDEEEAFASWLDSIHQGIDLAVLERDKVGRDHILGRNVCERR